VSTSHLLVLQVVIPLVVAPLCILIRKQALVWYVVLAVSWGTLFSAYRLLMQVLGHGEIIYFLGGWAAPWGIEYRLDVLNAFVLMIVASIGAIVMTYAKCSIIKEIAEDRVYLFYTAYLLNLTGLYGVVVTGDVFNMFVFIEISSLSSYAMISLGRERQALMAAYRYLILGTIGATFFLIGIGFLYAMTGTLNIADLGVRIPDLENTRTVITALAFLTVGISLKFALFPLHGWLPNAYTYAPSVVSAFLASTTTKVFIYVLLRILFSIFGTTFVFDIITLDRIFLASALLAIFSGSITAIYQTNVKRMLAWSSIAQIGYMILGVSLVSVTGLLAGIIHLFNHAIIKAALFMCMGCIFYRFNTVQLSDLKGVGRYMPWTMAAFILAGLSLIGVPLTVGFISKWYLIMAAIERDWWWLAFAIVAGSLLAVVYIWRVVEVTCFQSVTTKDHPEANQPHMKEAPLSMLIPLWILVIANIYFGINTELTVDVARQSAEWLLWIK